MVPVNHLLPRQKGQASIEFVLILLLALIIVMTIIVPLGERLQQSMEDVAKVGSLTSDLERIDQLFATLGAQQDANASQTITLFLPKHSRFICVPGNSSTGYLSVATQLYRPVFNYDGSDISGSLGPQNLLVHGCSAATVTPYECARQILLPDRFNQLLCNAESRTPFIVQSGSRGFSQTLRIDVVYPQSGSFPDVNVVVR